MTGACAQLRRLAPAMAALAMLAALWAGAAPRQAEAARDAPLPSSAASRAGTARPDAAAPPVRLAQRRRGDRPAGKADNLAKETVEADVSTRRIAITSAFTGTEIVVFGSVVNSRQPSAEAGYYDVIVVLEGMPMPLTARRKSRVAGLWINTHAFGFESAPSYYAIASTRPIEEIADESLLRQHAIGLDSVRLSPAARSVVASAPADLKAYKDAVIRLKQKEGLYLKADYAAIFIGKSLFRAAIALPANVPVGPLTARVYLLREGELLSTFQSRVRMQRSGLDLLIYQFAMGQPALYGLATVLLAVVAGLLASALFRRRNAV